jgi:hypothetical protein
MIKSVRTAALVFLLIALLAAAHAQEKKKKPAVPGPMLAAGYMELSGNSSPSARRRAASAKTIKRATRAQR